VETSAETVQQSTEYDVLIEAGSAESFETKPAMVSAVVIAGATVSAQVITQAPTKGPTTSLTKVPTKKPTKAPTRMPTAITYAPTSSPTPQPTITWQSRYLFWIWITGYLHSVGGMLGF
jgi:cell division septation protein DedD